MTSLSQDALRIFRAAVKAADPASAVEAFLRGRRDILRSRRVIVVGAGKASAGMARAAEKVLGSRIRAGFINTKYQHTVPLRRVVLNECAHPIPDANGVRGARAIAALARSAQAGDIVLCLISGGASSLLPLPQPNLTLSAKQRITQRLLASGANIHEFNCVRKHLSQIKGGHLAEMAAPAKLVTLILSDVVGDDLDVIGSGPTVPDHSTVADAQAVLKKYRISAPALTETPKPGDPVFARVENHVIGSNAVAVEAASRKARDLGYRTLILTSALQGEAREIARVHAAIAQSILRHNRPLQKPACVISGGEPTVTVEGRGKGGRNQEFALAAAIEIAGMPNVTILSAGTDGTDGSTDAAGAIATGQTLTRAQASGRDAARDLAGHDSYRFFSHAGGLIKTGPTGTNVMDLQLILVK